MTKISASFAFLQLRPCELDHQRKLTKFWSDFIPLDSILEPLALTYCRLVPLMLHNHGVPGQVLGLLAPFHLTQVSVSIIMFHRRQCKGEADRISEGHEMNMLASISDQNFCQRCLFANGGGRGKKNVMFGESRQKLRSDLILTDSILDPFASNYCHLLPLMLHNHYVP